MQSNISYWENMAFFSAYDVMVIGSGIVGLNAALYLKQQQPKLKVGVLESGFLPSGASTKNAGFACFGSVSEILDELNTTSEAEVLQVVESRWRGLSKLRETLGDQAIDYQQSGGYEIFKTGNNPLSDVCLEKIGYLNSLLKDVIGKTDIYAVANEKIADFGLANVGSMILNRYEAQIDTGKMMLALLQKVTSLGINVFNNCRLLDIVNSDSHFILNTSQGNFHSKKVIMATNAFIGNFYPELNVVPGRGQVLVTAPIPGLKINGTFHYDQGYYYFRNINNRILLGGGRNIDFKAEETTEAGTTAPVQSALEDLLYQTIIPGQKAIIEYRWSGVMAFGDQLKPIIKQIEPGVFCAVRCNGMGVAMGSLSGQQVAELVLAEL
ncbi:MAG TPA: FAD-dependent oxidoreductase [Daejeonella sp.]|nr:FAD-dependent oxidoreductase [Daejeonella sp.]